MRTIRLLMPVVAALCGFLGSCSAADEPQRRGEGLSGDGNRNEALPCEVARVLESKCSMCHGAETAFGAPMPLASWSDLHAPAVTVPEEPMYFQVSARIHDPARPMPPTTSPQLTPEERTVLDQWLAQGAPAGTGEACYAADPGQQPGQPGPDEGGGGIEPTPDFQPSELDIDPETNEVYEQGQPTKCFNLLAHGQQVPGDTSPFLVSRNARNLYQCFYFRAPYEAPHHGLTFKSVIDQQQVLHHWLLYRTDSPYADGSYEQCLGVHPDSELIAGWAPGADDWIMPPGVGMELPHGPTATYMLEVHYYNSTGADVLDRSGVEVCATDVEQPNTATISWLGTEAIFLPPGPGEAVGVCDPAHPGPIQIIRSWPHMHLLGRGMKSTIHRADGRVETLLDVPNYDFDYQIAYDTPATLHPGDRIETRCLFNNDSGLPLVMFGPGTQDEMCYNFVVAYPARALTSGGLMRNACML